MTTLRLLNYVFPFKTGTYKTGLKRVQFWETYVMKLQFIILNTPIIESSLLDRFTCHHVKLGQGHLFHS